MVRLVFAVDILQLPHTLISNSEKLTHPTVCSLTNIYSLVPILKKNSKNRLKPFI